MRYQYTYRGRACGILNARCPALVEIRSIPGIGSVGSAGGTAGDGSVFDDDSCHISAEVDGSTHCRAVGFADEGEAIEVQSNIAAVD